MGFACIGGDVFSGKRRSRVCRTQKPGFTPFLWYPSGGQHSTTQAHCKPATTRTISFSSATGSATKLLKRNLSHPASRRSSKPSATRATPVPKRTTGCIIFVDSSLALAPPLVSGAGRIGVDIVTGSINGIRGRASFAVFLPCHR